MKKKYSLGGIILKDGNSVEFKTGDWKNKYPYHDKEKCKNCINGNCYKCNCVYWIKYYDSTRI